MQPCESQTMRLALVHTETPVCAQQDVDISLSRVSGYDAGGLLALSDFLFH